MFENHEWSSLVQMICRGVILSHRQSCKLGALDKVCLVQTARVPVDQDKSSGEVAPDPVLSLPTSFGNIQTPTLQI